VLYEDPTNLPVQTELDLCAKQLEQLEETKINGQRFEGSNSLERIWGFVQEGILQSSEETPCKNQNLRVGST
jgi:hypothetical protein